MAIDEKASAIVGTESEPISCERQDPNPDGKPEQINADGVHDSALDHFQASLRTALDNRTTVETLSRVIEELETQVRDLRTKAEERRLISALTHIVSLEDSIFEMTREPLTGQGEPENAIDWQARLRFVRELTREALLRAGLIPITPAPGDLFNSKQHEAIAVTHSEDEIVDVRISVLHRPGYQFAGQLVRPASVTVLRSKGDL